MLKAATLFKRLLAKPPPLSCSFTSIRFKVNPHNALTQPVWKPLTSIRYTSTSPSQDRVASPNVEAAFRERDKVSPEYSIIYRAPLDYYIKVTYFSTWITLLVIPAIIGSMFLYNEEQRYPYEINGVPIFESATDAYVVTGMMILVILNIATTVSKYPFRIYRNAKDDKYVAVFQHALPWMIRKKEFVAGDVKKANAWIWKESCYAIKKKKMLVIPEHFSRPIELELMQIDPKQSNPLEIRKRRSRML